MTTEEMLSVAGAVVRDENWHTTVRVVAGKFGNAMRTDSGYVIADPCYLLRDADYVEMMRRRRDSFPAPRENERNEAGKLVRMAEWHELAFQGERVFWRDTSDGCGPWGLCIDSGWLAAIPVGICKPEVQEILSE